MSQVLLAIAAGAWLLTPDWIAASVAAGMWLNEFDFQSEVRRVSLTVLRSCELRRLCTGC